MLPASCPCTAWRLTTPPDTPYMWQSLATDTSVLQQIKPFLLAVGGTYGPCTAPQLSTASPIEQKWHHLIGSWKSVTLALLQVYLYQALTWPFFSSDLNLTENPEEEKDPRTLDSLEGSRLYSFFHCGLLCIFCSICIFFSKPFLPIFIKSGGYSRASNTHDVPILLL